MVVAVLCARLLCRYRMAVVGIASSCWLVTTYFRTQWPSMRRWNSSVAHMIMKAQTRTPTVKCSLAVHPSGSTLTPSGDYLHHDTVLYLTVVFTLQHQTMTSCWTLSHLASNSDQLMDTEWSGIKQWRTSWWTLSDLASNSDQLMDTEWSGIKQWPVDGHWVIWHQTVTSWWTLSDLASNSDQLLDTESSGIKQWPVDGH